MKFGIFDHMDEGSVPLEQQFEERLQLAEAYDRLDFHAYHLWDRRGMEFPLRLPPTIGPMLEVGAAFAGTAGGFRDDIAEHVEAIGANYLSCDVAFGDMTFDEAMRTTELIGQEVIPAFAGSK